MPRWTEVEEEGDGVGLGASGGTYSEGSHLGFILVEALDETSNVHFSVHVVDSELTTLNVGS